MSQPNNPWYPPNTPQPTARNEPQNPPPNYPPYYPSYYPPNYPPPRSSTNSSWYATRILRIFLIIFGIMTLVGIPILGYFIGNLIGIHMASNDVQQGYANGGLLYTIYNASHNPVLLQESQISQAQGIGEAQSDIASLQMLGLMIGLLADVPFVFLFVREYERMG